MPSIHMAQDFRKTLDIDDWEMVKILGGMVNLSFHFKKYFLPALVALFLFLNNFFMHQI